MRVFQQIGLLLIAATLSITLPAQNLRRSEGFFGFHFNIHAAATDSIGATVSEAMLDSLLTLARPDFIQVDCKGHPGIASYPTKTGYPAAFFHRDILKLYRDVTRRHGTPLTVHYSGLWDNEAVARHPEWARVDEKGQPDKRKTSLAGPYLDQLMLPQLREIIREYGVDAVWVDGDCWAAEPDYSPALTDRFRQETGFDAPRSKTDSAYVQWMEFNRSLFRNFLRRYTDSLHREFPGFEVCSNFAFSAKMPEVLDTDLDFLSGDISPVNSLYRAAFFGRCFAPYGKPWDLMAWSCRRNWDTPHDGVHTDKSLVQLEQEAAQVMALGGGIQTYWTQNRDGSLHTYAYRRMAQLAEFCRARQPFCHKAELVPQIGILYSVSAWKKASGKIYVDDATFGMQGLLTLLLDCQYPADIILEHQLAERIDRYPLIAVPEWTGIDSAIRTQLLEYVRRGGQLLVVGGRAVEPFQTALGVQFEKPAFEPAPFNGHIVHGDLLAGFRGWFQPVKPGKDVLVSGRIALPHDTGKGQLYPFATIARLGKGRIAGVYADIGSACFNGFQATAINDALQAVVDTLFAAQALVRVQGTRMVHVVTAVKNDQLHIHLLNTQGQHRDVNVFSYDELPPTPPLRLEIACAKKPRALMLQPGNQRLKFSWKNGRAVTQVPPVAVHSIVVVR